MIDPIALGQTKEYIAKEDRNKDGTPKENPTTWIIGPLDSMQKALIMAHSVEDEDETDANKKSVRTLAQSLVKQDFEVVRQGLKGFSNFGSIEYITEKIKFFSKEIDVVPQDILRQIPIIRELADVIWGENTVSKKLAKN